jgi:hypothetical protein
LPFSNRLGWDASSDNIIYVCHMMTKQTPLDGLLNFYHFYVEEKNKSECNKDEILQAEIDKICVSERIEHIFP